MEPSNQDRAKLTERFTAELGDRLRRIYGLERKPRGPDDFFRLLRAESAKHVGTLGFLDRVRSGQAVIGRSNMPTKDWIVDRAKKISTFCSYDTLMTAVLRGDAEIGSSCPHCGDMMSVRISGGKLEEYHPKGMMFLWGSGPEGAPGNPMCDHLHLFPNKNHLRLWIESKEGEMGFTLELEEAIQRLRDRF